MTKVVSYCSLEEAWGENYVDTKENTPEQVKPNKDISYSGGKQFSTDLLPQTQQEVFDDTIPNNSDMRDSHQNNNVPVDYLKNKDKYAMVPYNMDKEQLWDEFLEYVKRKNEEQRQNKNVEGFASVAGIIGGDRTGSGYVEPKKDSSYVDLLIVIMFGIIVIFILDSFVRFGRKSKRD